MPILGHLLTRMTVETPGEAIRVDERDHYHDEWEPPFSLRDVVRIKTNQKLSDFYDLFEEIGEGKFGKVFRCVEKSTGLELAAKCIQLKKDADLQKVEKEISVMTLMRHKCIAQIYDAFANSSHEVVLIMEIVRGGELFDRVVDDNYILTETAVAVIMYQICEALLYIHSQNIIHLDLKPENIMCVSLTGNQIKLIDFGLAQFYDGQKDLLFMAGTPEFAAPEVIKYEPLDFHTDMWSLGVITYILLSGQSPFLGDNIALTYCNVEKGNWSFCEEFDENGISEDARDFIIKLLIVDKSKRMLPEECLRHPWIVKGIERARNKSLEEKPLDTGKLRSYVRNKRFRRLVFGVLFINSVTRMLSTLQSKKSENGVQYVKNMLNAAVDAGVSNPAQSLVKSAFAKRRRNATGEGEVEQNATITETDNERPSTSQEGNELHRKPKRLNNNHTVEINDAIDEKTTNGLDVPFKSDASSPEASRTASPKLIKRQRDKVGRQKSSSSRKASSSEQAAKKPKQGSGTILTTKADVDNSDLFGENSRDTTTTTKVGGILAKFQQQQSNQQVSNFVLPVACFVPPKKPMDQEPSIKVTLTKPEEEESSSLRSAAETNEEKPKVKKVKKTSTKKPKSNSATIDLNEARSILKPVPSLEAGRTKPTTESKPDRKSADFLLDSMKKEESKPKGGVVSALLQRLEKNDAPPMIMAVSSFIPVPKAETTVETTKSKGGKVLRIEAVDREGTNEKTPKGPPSVVQILNLEKKVVTEKKTKLKKKNRCKELARGDSTRTENEREEQDVCELRMRNKTTTNEVGSGPTVEEQRMILANSLTSKERNDINDTTRRHVAEKTLESVASIGLQHSSRTGKKSKKKQLALSDEESLKVEIDATLTSPKRLVKRANGTAEKKHIQRATASDDDSKESVQFKSDKSVIFSADKLPANGVKANHELRFSIDDDVAAFKALMSKRHNKLKESRLAETKSNSIQEKFGVKLKPARLPQNAGGDDGENDEDVLIKEQQDAFDFSVLKSKLENRLKPTGQEQDTAYMENCQLKQQNLAEIRSKLSDTGNIRRAMNKWIKMDKETSQNK